MSLPTGLLSAWFSSPGDGEVCARTVLMLSAALFLSPLPKDTFVTLRETSSSFISVSLQINNRQACLGPCP